MYVDGPRPSKVTPGALGGALAIAGSLAGAATTGFRSGSSDFIAVSAAMVLIAGLVAVTCPRRTSTLIGADALVAVALTIELFSGLALLYVPALLFLLFGTIRARDPMERGMPIATHAPAQRPMLTTEWERIRKRRRPVPARGAAPAIRRSASAESLRRAG